MSRERYEEKAGMSPTQRKACVVLALCALAIVLSIVAAWVLPGKLGLFNGGASAYDKDAYRWIHRWRLYCPKLRRMMPISPPVSLRAISMLSRCKRTPASR